MIIQRKPLQERRGSISLERIKKLQPPPLPPTTATVKRDYLLMKSQLQSTGPAIRPRPAVRAFPSTSTSTESKNVEKVVPVSTPKQKKKEVVQESSRDDSPPGFSIRAHAERLLSLAPNAGECGHAFVRFNHYNKPFPVKNLVLQWSHIDEEYSFSFVYKGRNYRREIFEYLAPIGVEDASAATATATATATGVQKWGAKMGRDEQGDYFLGLKPNGNYLVTVVEEEEGAGGDTRK